MLTVVRNKHGDLLAACDWWLVDAEGRWQPQTGQYIFVHQLEVAPRVRMPTLIRALIYNIGQAAPEALGCFWKREHDAFPRIHAFRRSSLVQLREGVRV